MRWAALHQGLEGRGWRLLPPQCQAILDCLLQILSWEGPDRSEVSVQGQTRLKWLNMRTRSGSCSPGA